MKKIIKKIYYFPIKILLEIVFKLNLFSLLPLLIRIFPRVTHRVAFQLMKIGYLDFASSIIKNHLPQEWELPLVNRIHSMVYIKEKGLIIEKIKKIV